MATACPEGTAQRRHVTAAIIQLNRVGKMLDPYLEARLDPKAPADLAVHVPEAIAVGFGPVWEARGVDPGRREGRRAP